MKRKILLPTDFSKSATNAINYALELYKEDQCIFYILNVFPAVVDSFDSLINLKPGNKMYDDDKENSEKRLRNVLEDIAFAENNIQNHVFETISIFNNTLEAIKHTVEEKDIEIIVMGTKGEANSNKSAFGSIAISVMEKVRNCPVIVVPENAVHTMPKEIVFPTSYKTHFKKRELNYLIDVAKKCDASIAILHISETEELSDSQTENKQLLKEYFGGLNYSFHHLQHYSIEPAVNLFIQIRKSDMIAFINKKHTFFGSILTQPMVKTLGFQSKVPLLVMHDLRN